MDPDDDTLDRFIVWHYHYDEVRHERRNVVVIAFDDEYEFRAEIERRANLLTELQPRGDAEELERIGGVLKPAGSAAEASRRRTEWKVNPHKKARVRKRHRDER